MRFDHLMSEVNRLHALCVKHLNDLARNMYWARKAAYRFARKVMEVEENHHNEFLDYIAVHELDITSWMDEHFAPIEQTFNQDRRVLFANIRGGMTEKEYIKHGDLWTIHKERIHAVRPRADIDAPIAGEELSIEERYASLNARYDAVVAELRDLRRKFAIVGGQLELAERKVGNLTKVFTNKKAQ
jgi:hypothetical protein